jgi:hypothetical protein
MATFVFGEQPLQLVAEQPQPPFRLQVLSARASTSNPIRSYPIGSNLCSARI